MSAPAHSVCARSRRGLRNSFGEECRCHLTAWTPSATQGGRRGWGEWILERVPAARQSRLCTTATIDLDATDVEVYGRNERGVEYNHQGQRVGRPHVATWAEVETVLAAELLSGNDDPRSAPSTNPATEPLPVTGSARTQPGHGRETAEPDAGPPAVSRRWWTSLAWNTKGSTRPRARWASIRTMTRTQSPPGSASWTAHSSHAASVVQQDTPKSVARQVIPANRSRVFDHGTSLISGTERRCRSRTCAFVTR